MKIRDDLEGVVHVRTLGGVVVLAAGDTIPEGVEVGEHLTKPGEQKEGHEPSASKRRGVRPRQGTGSSGASKD
jgi:hypothetical protein